MAWTNGRVYDLTVNALETRDLLATGSYFKILSSSGLVRVALDTGAQFECLNGQGGRVDAARGNFSRLEITDLSGAGQTLRVMVANAEFIDDRVAGVVDVTGTIDLTTLPDRELTDSLTSGREWIGELDGANFSNGVGVANSSQLRNPVGSGVLLVVRRMSLVAGKTDGNGAPTSFATQWVIHYSTDTLGATVKGGSAKDCSGGISKGQLRSANATPSVFQTAHRVVLASSSDPVLVDFDRPIIVREGYGLTVYNTTAAANYTGHFEWAEVTP